MIHPLSSRALPLLGLLLAAAGASQAQQPTSASAPFPPSTLQAAERVRADALRAHVRFLADDLLEGRDTGSTGGALAARYIASQLEQLGVQPAGDRGGYFQTVPFTRVRMDPERSRLVLSGPAGETTLNWGAEFLINGSRPVTAALQTPLVFAGYGITAPEFHHDDYRGLDVEGRIVVLLSGQPPSKDLKFFDGGKPTRYALGRTKIDEALKRGAAGVITVLTPDAISRFPWDAYRKIQGTARVLLAESRKEAPLLVIRAEDAAPLFAGAKQPLVDVLRQADKGPVPGFALAQKARLELETVHEEFAAVNVAGMLRGSDSRLRDEVVVYTAHYDHVGKRTGDGDTIYNGAWDNASGTAGVLEVARAFAAMKPAPRRSILFLLVTGEEKGLLGSHYYVRHPLVPVEKTAADINLDMTDIFGVPKDFTPVGAEHSTLSQACEAVSRQLGMKVGPDPLPEQRAFTRSDVLSFSQAGVPALFLRWATEYEGMDRDTAKQRAQERLDRVYHQVTDEFDPSWSWAGMRKHAQVAFLLGAYVAEQLEMPRWNANDPFAAPRRIPTEP